MLRYLTKECCESAKKAHTSKKKGNIPEKRGKNTIIKETRKGEEEAQEGKNALLVTGFGERTNLCVKRNTNSAHLGGGRKFERAEEIVMFQIKPEESLLQKREQSPQLREKTNRNGLGIGASLGRTSL